MAISWRPPAGPCLRPVPNINLCLVKARRMIHHSPVIYDRVSYNIVIGLTSYCLCHVLLVRSKSQIVPTLRDGDYTRAWITEGHIRVCPPLSLSPCTFLLCTFIPRPAVNPVLVFQKEPPLIPCFWHGVGWRFCSASGPSGSSKNFL